MKPESLAVLDFGGQYAHLIATKVRQLGVHAEIRDPDDPVESFRGYKGIVLSGSPALSSRGEDGGWSRGVLDLGIPVLGFCFGHQEIAKHAGGRVQHSKREYGQATLNLVADSPLFEGLESREQVWMSHGDSVTGLGRGFIELGYSTGGSSDNGHRNAAIACEERRLYGLQFHPEVDDTPCGQRILGNFARRICGVEGSWSVGGQIEERVSALREEIGDRTVLLLASGGVDSTVAAVLIHRAIGSERLHLLHIDNGLMRKNESARVGRMLEGLGLGKSLRVVDASAEFLSELAGETDPEVKRRAIGETFVAVFEREAAELDRDDVLLGQGTIYPDTIETGGTRRADVIKTHHNRVALVEEMIAAGRVVEPLRDLYKVEVRELGRALGLDDASVDRHPFPGPGLGIRVACADSAEDFDGAGIARAAAASLEGTGLSAVPLPVRSVGVKGDLRSYEHPVLLCGESPGWAALTGIATTLTKQVPGINRCLFALGGNRPSSAELVPATVTRERLDLLRELDAIVMDALARHGQMSRIWQCPTVLVPVRLDGRGTELAVVRPVLSERAMTARAGWPGDAWAAEVAKGLAGFEPVSGVAIDVTSKPPATIEWE